jgi:RalA-binding protein 1
VMENDRVFGTPIDITTPVSPYPADTPLSGVTPESVRSPRHKPSADFTTPNYNQTGFFHQSAPPSRDGYDTGIPPAQVSNKENGSTSYHDRFSASNGIRTTQLGNTMSKQAKRDSNVLHMNLGPMSLRESPLSRLREADGNE